MKYEMTQSQRTRFVDAYGVKPEDLPDPVETPLMARELRVQLDTTVGPIERAQVFSMMALREMLVANPSMWSDQPSSSRWGF
jgi:hypothetical protein